MSRIDKNLTKADRRGNSVIAKALAQGPLAPGQDQAAVKWMERMLNLAGFGVGKPDSKFGTRTVDALKAFQASVGLPATGELDTQSFAKLKNVEIRVRNHPKDEFISTGQAGKRVLDAEKKLARLGYDVGKVDGVFDAQDAAAIKAFRADQKELKDGSGVLGGAVHKSLSREVNALHHDAWRSRVKTSKPRVRLDKLTAQEVSQARPDGTVGVREGDKGRSVANIQAHLKAAGFDPNGKGAFDERTRAMVETFQRRAGLPVTGVVDADTWAKLAKSEILAKNGTSPAQAEGERSGAVKHTEKLLRELGYKHVKADGIFNARTEQAVKAFEKKHHLKVDGEVGAKDLKAINKAVAGLKSGDDAYRIAHSQLGKNASWLKTHGPLAKYFDDNVSTHVCCANFVSACLEYAGLITHSQHTNSVSTLASNLAHDKDWKREGTSHLKPGDVVCFTVPGEGSYAHVEMFAGYKNGVPTFIGSNNVNSDGSQRVSIGSPGYHIDAVYRYHG
jgi:peptidoglycan hydrolase-like protein with peptidoglycan-binding domain